MHATLCARRKADQRPRAGQGMREAQQYPDNMTRTADTLSSTPVISTRESFDEP